MDLADDTRIDELNIEEFKLMIDLGSKSIKILKLNKSKNLDLFKMNMYE